MPGRSGSSPPPRMSPSSSTSVVPWCEGAGWTTSPAGLSTTASASSRWTIRSCGSSATLGLPLGLAQVDEDEHQDAQGDRDVGEVEGGPWREVDVVGHLA